MRNANLRVFMPSFNARNPYKYKGHMEAGDEEERQLAILRGGGEVRD